MDPAILRRLDKRIYVPLPDPNERKDILQSYFKKAMEGVTHSSRGTNSIECNVDFSVPACVSNFIVHKSYLMKIQKDTSTKSCPQDTSK